MKKKEEKMKRLQSEGGESGLRNTPSKSFRSLSKNKNLKKKQGNKQESESKPRNLNLNFEMFLKAGGSNEYPLIPIISDSMQSKILEEQKRMDNSLFNKINNGIMRNFLLKGKSKSKAVNADGVIDLTQEEENNSINNSPSSNKLPTEEEAKAAFEAITKNGVINLIALNDIAKSDPILYYKMNNLYLSNPILSNNSITSANTTSLLTQKPNISANVKRIYKYPIEDEEVYKNPEIHNIPQDFLNKPSGKAPLIPNDHISIIFKIWDFLQTFKSKLNISEFSPEQLYFSLKHFSEEEIPLITEIHTVLLFIIGEQIRKYDYTTLLANEDYEVMLIKLALENTSLSSRLVFKKSWPEIIRLVIHSGNQAFSLMVTEELNNISQKLRHLTTKSYNLALTYEEKVGILEYLVNTVVNSDFVREIVKEDIEKRTLLNREKSDLHNELKANEIRKKEIERQEKFTQPRQKVDSLTARLQTLVEDNQHLSRQELTKLRKELEQEREQFKSVIKEGEEIETIKNKITSRIEKLSNEIFEIPSTNKKLIGTDGLKDEYYFYPSANNKLYVKKRTSIGGVKKYEWRELTTEEEIKELLSKLSEKGVNEKNLLTKIKKLYPKRLKVSTAQDEDINMIEDKTQRVDEENILKSALEWKNTQMDKWNKKFDKTEDNTFQEFVENLLTLEEKVTEYLFQDEKEWESHDVRQNWKAWLTYIDDISEYSKCLIMFNNKFRNPYKINDFLGGKSKIINDEEETYQSYIFTEDNKLAPNKVNPHRTIAPKSKLWSKELEGMEDIYVDYVANGVKSMPGLFLAYYIFDAVFNDLVRRREIYKKKDLGLGTNFEDENYYNTHSSNSVSNVNNFNNVNNVNSSNPVKNKKIINDEMDIDDFCYNEEAYTGVNGYKNKSSEFMVEIDISGKESYLNEESVRTRSRRLGGGSKTTTSSGLSQPKRKNIDWHDECYVCYEVGDLICCEDCPNVVHLSCAKLKVFKINFYPILIFIENTRDLEM